MLGLAAFNPIWITLGPLVIINAVLFTSYITYLVWGRKRREHNFAGAKRGASHLLSGATRDWWLWTTDPIVHFFVRAHLGPNALTAIGSILSFVAAILYAMGAFGYAGWTMIFGATFDIFDGRVARITGKTSRSGGFLDAVMDRFSEGAVFLGLAYYFRSSWLLVVIVAGLIGSFLVSYTRARAEAMGVECTVGTMQRPERIVYLGVASIFSPVVSLVLTRWWPMPPPVLVILSLLLIAVMTNATAIRRMIFTMNALDTEDRREKESIPQIITRLATPEGREAFWEKARYGYDRSRAQAAHVILFLMSGIDRKVFDDMLSRGDLPNVARYMLERGGRSEAISTFPSAVGPTTAPFVTGCFPGTCDIPGVRWFDRTVPESRVLTMNRFRDYAGWGAYAMDHDLSKSVSTIFEYSRQAVNIFGVLNRGCGLVRDPAFFRLHSRFHRAQRLSDIETADAAAAHWFASAIRRETDFVLYCFPPTNFLEEGRDARSAVVDAYRRLDQDVGRAVDLLRERGMEERSVLMLASDHATGVNARSFDLEAFLAKRFRVAPLGRRMRDWQEAEVIALPSGTSMAHISLRHDGGWERRPFFEEIEQRGLVGSLLEEECIDCIAGRSVDGGICVQSRRGRAQILEDADGRITYIVKGSDPFGYEGLGRVMDANEALRTTSSGSYPDGLVQLAQLFRSRRSGDLVVSAAPDVSLLTSDTPAATATQGSLAREHLVVPYLSSIPMRAGVVRTADIFARVLDLLGIEARHAIDGVLREPIESVEPVERCAP